jgi:hypothetical protein
MLAWGGFRGREAGLVDLESPPLRMGLDGGPDRVDPLHFRPGRSFTLFGS